MDYMLIIDPQNDFMDLPGAALPVKGAVDDMNRLASFISSTPLDGIMVSLDSHSPYDIGHAGFWKTKNGETPPVFSIVTASDVANGRIVPADKSIQSVVGIYLMTLERKGRYQHTIWPNHCEPGSWGHQIPALLLQQIHNWSSDASKPVDYIFKGMNPYTESYSAFCAEISNKDPSTQVNQPMISKLWRSRNIYIAGEALSHCVKSSVETLLEYIPADKFILLEDCMSPVPGFEQQGKDFIEKMRSLGAKIKKTTDYKKVIKCQ